MTEILDPTNPDHAREIAESYIIYHTEPWLNAKAKDERAAGMSADALRERHDTMAVLNHLLDEYFELFVKVPSGAEAA